MMKKIIIALFLMAMPLSAQDNMKVISKYHAYTDMIIEKAREDSSAWERLAYICDMFGHRLNGSEGLENAIDYIKVQMIKDGLENVQKEEVMVPNWKRGEAKATLLNPREENIPIVALGGSIGTDGDIEADVLVVSSLEDLEANKDKAKGKIVVFDLEYKGYGSIARYRVYGADYASKYGAVACLARSVSPHSYGSPHTGMMRYRDSVPRIPHGAIAEEHSRMLARIQSYGVTPKMRINMSCENLEDAKSHNVMAELRGTDLPNEIIALGGHIDSWDLSSGAHDDMSGCIATWMAVKLLKDLDLRPRRTLRAVMWTNEERGGGGGKVYRDNHKHEKHVLMFEMDAGCWAPQTIGLETEKELYDIYKPFEYFLRKVNDSIRIQPKAWGVDIRHMVELGVPMMHIDTDDQEQYFIYHHSAIDTPEHVDPKDLNDVIATIAIAIYLYADLPFDLPSNFDNNPQENK